METDSEVVKRKRTRLGGLVAAAIFLPFFVVWSYQGIAVELGRLGVVHNLVTTNAILTDLDTIESRASAQDGGYITSTCTATVAIEDKPTTVRMPCITYTQFHEGSAVEVTTWHGQIVAITDAGDPIPAIRSWDTGVQFLFVVLMYPIMLTSLLIVFAQTIALVYRRRFMNTTFAVVMGVVIGYGVAIFMTVMPAFTYNLGNPWWAIVSPGTAFLITGLVLVYRVRQTARA